MLSASYKISRIRRDGVIWVEVFELEGADNAWSIYLKFVIIIRMYLEVVITSLKLFKDIYRVTNANRMRLKTRGMFSW